MPIGALTTGVLLPPAEMILTLPFTLSQNPKKGVLAQILVLR